MPDRLNGAVSFLRLAKFLNAFEHSRTNQIHCLPTAANATPHDAIRVLKKKFIDFFIDGQTITKFPLAVSFLLYNHAWTDFHFFDLSSIIS